MMSTRVFENSKASQIATTNGKNRTAVASIKKEKEHDEGGDEEEETKAVSNSQLWGDLGQSTSNSHLMSQTRFPNLLAANMTPNSRI